MIPIVVDHLWKFIFLHLKLNFSWNWCHLSLKILEEFFFFLGMDWVNLVKLELTQQLKWNKGGGGRIFFGTISFVFIFLFYSSLLTFLSSSIVSIHLLPSLAFSPTSHHFFSRNHFPKLLNLLSFISLNIFSNLCVLNHLCYKPIFETHLQTSIFFLVYDIFQGTIFSHF